MRQPEAYPWSTHRAYLGQLPEFPSRRTFHKFVLFGNDDALEAFYGAGRQVPVLGSEGFRERVRAKGGPVSREHPRHERRGRRPAVERVLKAVTRAYGVPVSGLRAGQRERASETRKVAMCLVRKLCDLTLAEAVAQCGVSSYGTVAWACHQVRAAMQSDATVRRRLQRIEGELNQPKT